MRELANAVERAVILSRGGVLRPDVFQGILAAMSARPVLPTLGALEAARAAASGIATPVSGAPPAPEPLNLDELERLAIQRALVATGGNRTRAAKLLGISERTLRNKLNVRRVEATAADN